MEDSKPLFAFVLMPFDQQFDDVYKIAIRETAKEFNIVAERVDDQIYTESILERILRQIENADFVVADMTGQNSNVFYEVGYAHAKEKICTLITQDASDIPFDLKHHRHIVYGESISNLQLALRKEFGWLRREIEKKKKNIFEVSFKVIGSNLDNSEWRGIGTLDLKIDIYNRSNRRTPEIDALYLFTTDSWTFSQFDEECPSVAAGSETAMKQHAIKLPMSRIAAGAFAQVTLEGSKTFWNKFTGEERMKEFTARGDLKLEIATAEGSYFHEETLEVTFEEFPF